MKEILDSALALSARTQSISLVHIWLYSSFYYATHSLRPFLTLKVSVQMAVLLHLRSQLGLYYHSVEFILPYSNSIHRSPIGAWVISVSYELSVLPPVVSCPGIPS